MADNPFLISPAALAAILGSGDLKVVDASWYMPAQNRSAKAEFETAHIPGAVFFDQDEITEPGAPLPHTLPSAKIFAEAVGQLGIAETDRIIVYDGLGLFSAARVWWMFRAFGATNVQILDGGFPAWQAAGLETKSGPAVVTPRRFAASFDAEAVASFEAMRRHVEAGDIAIADARSAERFAGSVPEPRAGVRSGHMPGARSLPFTELVRDGGLKPPGELREAFATAGIDPDRPIVTSCGSGVTAAVINLALATLGNETAKLYDGSWTEWGSAAETPVETGLARSAGARS